MRLLTRDLYEGAYLLSQGMELKEIWKDGNNGKKAVVFEFAGDNLELLRKDYQIGKAQVNILKLKSSLNELKDRMFSLLRSAEHCGENILRNDPIRADVPKDIGTTSNGTREDRDMSRETYLKARAGYYNNKLK